jgi:chorismate mutase/prephenate dehydratase
MSTIATLGPAGSDSWQAALQYGPDEKILLFKRIPEVFSAFTSGEADYALVPVYNTREGGVKEYFRLMAQTRNCYWADNVVLPIHLSLGIFDDGTGTAETLDTIVGTSSVFRQCRDYLEQHFSEITLMAVSDIESAVDDITLKKQSNVGIIESEELIKRYDLKFLAREVVSHNRTRFAVLKKQQAPATGYDATAIITRPLKDRVGMLADILGEFTLRGINILDLQSENDIKTQKLRIYLEVEGHQHNASLQGALSSIEKSVIQEQDCLRILGSFPRVDMRVKNIKSFGFIGSGAMSEWFAVRLENEGYRTILTGRKSAITPEEMIRQVDVVAVCVPISVTADTIKKYGPLLKEGQALIILAGESENTIDTAIEATEPGVEVMFVHNLWGPQALTMKDKNATVVRTPRSGSFCSEFEAFLYKHGADIYQDSAKKHDLLMGVGQKLPTTVSVALAMTLKDHAINFEDIGSHSTLTSLYGILAMARIHNQNPRTYAEIMATSGEGKKIVRSFAENILRLIDLAENGKIDQLFQIMENNRNAMPESFLDSRMRQAKAVDDILSKPGLRTT